MAIYRVQTSIDGVFTSMDFALDGKRIQLAYDGNRGYQSIDLFDLSGNLVVQWIGVGLSFQDWKITLQICAKNDDGSFGDPGQWVKQGSIPQGGGSQLYETIDPTKLKPGKGDDKKDPA